MCAKIKNRIGEINYNSDGLVMKIIEYNSCKDITVVFDDGYKKKAQYKEFKNGHIRNPYAKVIYNIGYIGEGKYLAKKNHKNLKQYNIWSNILERCYDTKSYIKKPTYKDCSVCEEWHNYQIFAEWYDDNCYEVGKEKMHLDKDILHKGNKIYSPENCIFVPQTVNKLFTKSDKARGEYPIGVYYKESNNGYVAQCKIGGGKPQKYLGLFNTPEEAFKVYKKFKENYIKEVADEYKDRIPKELYEAMYRYEVEITD